MKIILSIGVITLLSFAFVLPSSTDKPSDESSVEAINWMSFEEAVEANKTNPKKILIDVYTDWCGWCKVMDKETFTDPEIVEYISTNFHAVKLDAEQKESIFFKDVEFVWKPSGRNGMNELAVSLLNGSMSFPSFVILTEDYKRIRIIKGYKKPQQFMPHLKFAAEEQYNKGS